jgi:hypothetical protein
MSVEGILTNTIIKPAHFFPLLHIFLIEISDWNEIILTLQSIYEIATQIPVEKNVNQCMGIPPTFGVYLAYIPQLVFSG